MRALIIEDEKRLAAVLKRILEDQSFRCDAVNDGQSGIDFALANSYDVILLDVMLPDKDGFDVVKTIREAKVHTPVLMLTAKDSIPDKVLGLNAGADDYMTKPFSTEELIARVKALTRRSGEVILSTLSFHDITLDLSSFDLKSASSCVHLSPREFEVMRLLLSSPRVAVTKETLILNVWGADSNADDNNVEAYISFLRRKLRFLSSRVSIKNLQRVGYRLETEE
ncbi:MAG: response regulator transcription factor [Clostridia bacterium]|nr:response regulator transcription factor [Clostridia bacterium]